MESEIPQLNLMHDRLRMLLSTHLFTLNHETLTPMVGEVVIQQDTTAERVRLIQSGELQIKRTETLRTTQLIATVGDNEVVGEIALMGNRHHSATVTVSRGTAELLAVRADDLMQSTSYHSGLVMELLALCSSRCRRTSRSLELILEALIQKEDSNIERCCNEMREGGDQALLEADDRLRQLVQALEQT